MQFLLRRVASTKILFCAVTSIVLMAPRAVDAGMIYDVAGDFSLTSNPNGVWSYGSAATLGGPFTAFTNSSTAFLNPNFQAWGHNIEFHPFVAYNTAGTNQQGGGLNLDPGTIGFHPGRGFPGLLGVIRFTTPNAGEFDVAAAFQGRDRSGTTTDVHILLNNVSLLDGVINRAFGPGSGPSYSNVLSLSAGDTLDFVVGNGGNNFFNDSTGLDATITDVTPVPEPSGFAISMVLLMTVAAAAAFCTRRRRGLLPVAS